MNRAILAAAASTLAASAFAGVVASNDFSGSGVGWSFTYGYQVTPPYTKELVPLSGLDGTQSIKLVADFSGVPMAPWGSTYFGVGFGDYMTVGTQPMTTIMSEYSASFDAKVAGTYNNTGHSNVKVELQFFCNDDTNPDGSPMAVPDADEESQFIASFKTLNAVSVLAENVWESRTLSFDMFAGADIDGDGPGTALYTWDNVQAAIAAGNLHGMNMALPIDDGSNSDGRYGIDAGNELWVDNFKVSVVPEPTSLTAIAAAGLLLIRRRK